MKLLIAIVCLLLAAGALIYGDAERIAYAQKTVAATATEVTSAVRARAASSLRAVDIPRKNGGEFAVHAKINNFRAPMVVDTGATSVVLTYETAKAIGLPLEFLEYNVDLETASGRTRAARLTLDRIAVGTVVERSVPALVVPRGQAKSNLLGLSFLDRLESWEVRADRMTIRGYP
ncbi:TIGR02281 family clan AA aspartic protease [Bradyrhizobium sp. LHD-71]|uniref:TIGR02281 family clan AA aspartic protease n=1 Tax=Bradyrhizobium sp. LHD-71 TaxID=3072141 RepID=UPI00280D593B|nr:TIGR02281 family clan AA aspartic protease [Bradyrhizobium sp. LHD-71]MDQ8728623.1 TIGR02281 family clan AA aspartic protease [Bradyrhizobium sp. LHD-71]